MEIKLSQLVSAAPALQELGSIKLKAKQAYGLAKNLRHIQAELDLLNQTRDKLIKEKYGALNEDGHYQVPNDKIQAFIDEMNELQDSTIQLDIHAIQLDDSFELSISSMAQLEWLFVE